MAGGAIAVNLPPVGRLPLLILGLPDIFTEHGDPAKILSHCGLDAAGIEKSIRQRFAFRPTLAAVNS